MSCMRNGASSHAKCWTDLSCLTPVVVLQESGFQQFFLLIKRCKVHSYSFSSDRWKFELENLFTTRLNLLQIGKGGKPVGLCADGSVKRFWLSAMCCVDVKSIFLCSKFSLKFNKELMRCALTKLIKLHTVFLIQVCSRCRPSFHESFRNKRVMNGINPISPEMGRLAVKHVITLDSLPWILEWVSPL